METVELIPLKGSNLKKYCKRRHPDEERLQEITSVESPKLHSDHDDESSDDKLPDITFDTEIEEYKENTVQEESSAERQKKKQ